jgi:hypothetical protein
MLIWGVCKTVAGRYLSHSFAFNCGEPYKFVVASECGRNNEIDSLFFYPVNTTGSLQRRQHRGMKRHKLYLMGSRISRTRSGSSSACATIISTSASIFTGSNNEYNCVANFIYLV